MTQSTSDATAASPLPSPKERRRLREAKSLTEEQVAAAVGVTRATVRAWETGRTSPRGRKREAYARLLTDTGAVSGTAPAEPSAPPPPAPVEPSGSDAMAAMEPGEAVEPGGAVEPGEAVEPGDAGEPEAGAEAVAPLAPVGPGAGVPAVAVAVAVADGASAPQAVAPVAPTAPEAGVPEAPPAAPDDAADTADTADTAEGGLSPAQAFDALYQHAASALFRQTYLLTGRHTLSRTAVAKAFELAWERWPEVAVDRDPVGWVRAAAYEYAMSPWRRLNREHRRPDPPPEAPDSRALLDALLALPPSYRRTLVLHDGVGLGLPDTAAETEASTRAAAGRLVTARAAVAERLPEVAGTTSPDAQSALIHEHLGTLARSRPAASLPVPELIRTGSERKAQLWARTAIAFTVLIVGLTLITLATAPRKYETPPSPAQKVGGVPPVGGPQKLTPQDVKLRKQLGDELFNGPARLVPETG
ncbi:DNA-directed RNA polymerase specialized sigma subunit, sigma24 family [Streptomyces sp. 2131.1]|uniref:helix-turn-helix domain-containing protein n=1 Tax=Streptomyces sp. 2131.1 TaxID=1855346 RepID=UPI000899D123|nr:helix-turn-helix domain-containing protein [Streptomyces sp. 2131.1]SEC78456.1 DNA-directed RNA polymerase specialized sigma subunit, sigma24 family [Streptomyces sp. 2131.1]